MHGETTEDPRASGPRIPTLAAQRVELEVVFAADLSLVGHRTDLGPANLSFRDRVVGRDAPTLSSLGRQTTLGDPCISRKQLAVSWDAARRVFTVRGEPGARRPLTCFTLEGDPMPDGQPGARLAAIGDRALLLFTVRRAEPAMPSILLGNSDAMRELRSRIVDVAPHSDVALVLGPTGAGKELVARELHEHSGRNGPFVAVNAAALPSELVESELFGHAKGAFSGAHAAKDGLFHTAAGGTLFLDELGEFPLGLQAKLLRAIEHRRVRRVGASQEDTLDVRIVAATHRDLASEVAAGRFREDLYYRLLGLTITVPPLREHVDDKGSLFVTFLRRHVSEAREAKLFCPASAGSPPLPMELFLSMLRHPFPGNVRELDRFALDVATRGDAATRSSPARAAPRDDEPPSPGGRDRPSRDELERALARNDYVQQRVAKELGVPYVTLDRWLRDAGVRRPRDLSVGEVRAALLAEGDVARAAIALRVSVKGLKQRIAELGL